MAYTINNASEIKEMLETCKVEGYQDLYAHVPKEAKFEGELNLDLGKSEMEVISIMKSLSKENKVYSSIFRGAGAYNHFIPSAVKSLGSLSNFVTSYTPYQAEISQGLLQGIFEYQSMICNITGMDASNASVYDCGTAASEAVHMTTDKKRNKILVSKNVKPSTLEILKTYAYAYGDSIEVVNIKDGLVDKEDLKAKLDETVACFYVESPNFYGLIEDTLEIGEIVHENKSKYILGADPLSFGILKTPKEANCDIAVGEGQSLGLPLSFGGPYYGYMASTKELVRKLPGRIVGQTVDSNNKVGYVLTLQAREQHIRREKASSSICSNQSLCALNSAIYMASIGPKGFYEVSKRCYDLSHYAYENIKNIKGYKNKYETDFFLEFVIETPVNVDIINERLKKDDILGGYRLSDNEMLMCVTEVNTKEEIDKLVEILKEFSL